MLFNSNLLFFGTTAGAFASISGTTGSTTSAVINLTVAEELGIGDGVANPKVALYIGTAITTACATETLNFQFQGSTDNSNWTTYVETGALATSSLLANSKVFAIDWPHRLIGASMPQYVRLNVSYANGNTPTISSGTLFGGIVLSQDGNTVGLYSSGFSVI